MPSTVNHCPPCVACNSRASFLCSLCRTTRYCSVDCSKRNWPMHRAFCASICSPPGVVDASPNDPAVVALAIGMTSVNLSASPSKTVISNPATANATSSSVANAVSPKSQSLQMEPIGWRRCEGISDTEFTKVLVTTNGVSELWVNLFCNGPSIVKLHADLQAAAPSMASCLPAVGQCYAGCYDGQWCRVKVTTVTPKLKVHYIDFGNEDAINLRDMRALPAQFLNLPAQAIRIQLANAAASKYKEFPSDSIMFVQRVSTASDGVVRVVVQGEKSQDFPVQELASDRFQEVVVLESVGDTMLVNAVAQGAAMSVMTARLARAIGPLARETQPTMRQLVAAEFVDDSGTGWYRGRVTGLDPLRVFFLDFGNEAVIPVGGVKPLPDEFFKMPAQAVSIKFLPGSPKHFQALPVYSKLRVRAAGKVEGCVLVEPAEIADLKANNPAPVAANIVEEKEKSPCHEPEKVIPGTRQDVFCVHRQGADWFVQKREATSLLLSMTLSMKDAVEGTKASSVVEGDLVLALFDGEWSRARVVSSRPGLRVCFLDYGNEETVPPGDVRPMPDNFKKIPAQCWRVRLTADTPPTVRGVPDYSVFGATFVTQEAGSVWSIRGESVE